MKKFRFKGFIPLLMAAVLALTSVSLSAQTTNAETVTGRIATDFEDGTVQGWYGRGGVEILTATAAAAHSGTYGLRVAGRTQGWNGPQLDVTSIMETGKTYTISAWLRLPAGAAESSVSMTVQRTTNGVNSYEFVQSATVTEGGWVAITGQYQLLDPVQKLAVYFESANPTLEFYMDDFVIQRNPEPEPIKIQNDIPSLKDVFASDFKLGTALLVNEISNPDGPDAQLLKKHFNSLTAGNELKWDATQPRNGEFNFARADQIFQFAMNNGIDFRGHTLIWHIQTPDWVFRDANGGLVSKEVLFGRMKQHIETVVGRYKGKIYAWDVVNEVIEPADGKPGGLRNSLWYQIAGEEFIEKAFEYAHAADPAAKLFINDYNTHEPQKRQFLHDLIKRLMLKGVPVDGIGHQMHIGIQYPSVPDIDATINAFKDLGIEQQITELDMSVYTNDTDKYDTFPLDLQMKQAVRYKEIFNVFRKHKNEITAVVFWGKDDQNTWLRTFPIVRNNWPLLFDERLQAKPAYWALVPRTTTAARGTPVIDGSIDPIWNGSNAFMTDRWVAGTSGATANVRTLWDDGRLYVLAEVTDSLLSKRSANVWEQDSIEIFVDPNNGKTSVYEPGDGQYRINFDNEKSVSSSTLSGNLVSAVTKTANGYIVEASIAWPNAEPKSGNAIGFDVQVNNDQDGDGDRDSVAIWNDTSGVSYLNTSGFGILKLEPTLVSGNSAEAGMPMSKLHVSGNQLVNSSGQPVLLSGWHQPAGSYWTYQNSSYYLERNGWNRHAAILEYLKDITDTFTSTSPKYGNTHGWYMNQVRLFIDRQDMGDVAAGKYNFAGLQAVTQNVIIPYIAYAKTKGLYVTLGLDFTLQDNQATTQANLDKFNEIWGYLASQSAIKSADNVMFELINEPVLSYANGGWGGNPSESDFADHWKALRDFQNSMIATIRNKGADNVIWAAGLGWDQHYQLCAAYPLTDPLNNVGYAVHWYPGYGANDDYTKLQQLWDTSIKPCAASYPINITETTWFKWKTGDSEYWKLFDGTNAGFGKNTKAIFTDAGNVSIAVHMNGFLLNPGTRSSFADPTAGLLYDGDTTRDGMARFIFEWFYERAQLNPWNGISNGITSGSTYKIINRASGKAIDVPGGQNTNGLQLQQLADNNASAQRWVVDDRGTYNNYYRLRSVSSPDNKVMDVRNGTKNNGEAIQLLSDLSNNAQKFRLIKLSNGYWSIINVNSNKAVEVAGASATEGAKLQQNSYRGDLNQQWQLVKIE